jgi:kynurenine formamidase
MVGFDTCSADILPDFPVHKILLGNDMLIIENLTNIEQLSGHSFTVYALPIKLVVDGAPARVIAVIN